MVLTCADDGEVAANLHWTSWSANQATATGTVTWRACTSSCATSTQKDSASADYTLSDPVLEAGTGFLFTRLEMRVTGSTPQGFLRDLAFDEAPVTAAAAPLAQPQAAQEAPAIQAAASGTLSYANIEGYWLIAGGPDSSSGGHTDAQVAAAITGAESSFLPGIIQPGVDYCGAGADRAGWGLWQITCGNSVPQYGTDFQILDPWNNAEEAVFKCKQDMDAGFNCFTPWSTYIDGAYANFLQTTAPDKSISDPGEYVQINGTPAGTPSSPSRAPGSTYGTPMPNSNKKYSQAGGPVVDDPDSGNLELYAVGTDGALFERAFSRTHGWSGWVDLGGSVAGTPSAIYDPVTKNLEVYVRGAGGPLYEKAWNAKDGWSNWYDLGSAISGSPEAIYDPLSGNLEVYAVTTGGAVVERAFSKGSWTGWSNLGGSVTASPSVLFDPVTQHLEVYVRGAGGPLYEKAWKGSWTNWYDLGSAISGSPDAIYDSLSGNLEVYAVTTGGAVVERAFSKSSWSGWANLGGSVTASPSALYDPVRNHTEIYVRGTDGPVYDKAWNSATGWSNWYDVGDSITGNPDAIYDPLTGNLEVYAVATNGAVVERAFSKGSWTGWFNLSGSLADI
jgi:hypothetical protein